MGKKRRAWWIAGGVATAFALFVLTVFLIDYNSTDARVERAVAQIVEEYGFEFQDQGQGFSGAKQRGVKGGIYRRSPIDAETAEEIVALLSDACPSWKHEYTVYDEALAPVTTSGGVPWQEVHNFNPTVQDEGRVAGISFIRDDKGFGMPEYEPAATLLILKFDESSLWWRIKEMWPW